MSTRPRLPVAAVAALLAALTLQPARAAADSSLWEDVAHPHRRRCSALLDQATKLSGDGVRTPSADETRAARAALTTAAELCGDDREVLQRAGELLLGLHELSQARRHLERARVLADAALANRVPPSHERDVALAFHLGFAREVTGDLGGAIVEHRRLEALGGMPAPNQYLVHYNLGDELMAVGRLSEAIEEYTRAVALKADKPVVRLALAVALDRDERRDQAGAELTIVLAQDPQLKRLAGEEYVFVPAADAHYYRAVALLARGSTADARLELRAFLAELPDGPYASHARRRLVEAEHRVDARELDASSATLDKTIAARALAPIVGELEACLPAGRVVRIRLAVGAGALRAPPDHPVADCLDRTLSRLDRSHVAAVGSGAITLPLAGRRAAASLR
ncbi:MAG: lipoprotein NlpI [Myxococcales bacterium]|nr:lipoprotein NlpI [Myxococcales bacterium]